MDGAARATSFACTAINAFFSIDDVISTALRNRDCTRGTLFHAGGTCRAIVCFDNVGHGQNDLGLDGELVLGCDGIVFDGIENSVDRIGAGHTIEITRGIIDHNRSLGAHVETTGDSDLNSFEHAVLDLALKVREQIHGLLLVTDALAFAIGTKTSTDKEMMGWFRHG